MLEILILLLVLQHVIVLYLLITDSVWLDDFIGKLPKHPIALDILEEKEIEYCVCGLPLDECPDSYDHMTHGV